MNTLSVKDCFGRKFLNQSLENVFRARIQEERIEAEIKSSMPKERKSDMSVRRGDIYYADLSPVVGSEQGGLRPVLIIQNDIGNKYSPTVIAAAITSRMSKTRLPTHIDIYAEEVGLAKDSVILLEQIRTLDKRRLKEKMGHLDERKMDYVNTAIAISFGLGDPGQDAAMRAMMQRSHTASGTHTPSTRPAAAVASTAPSAAIGTAAPHSHSTATASGAGTPTAAQGTASTTQETVQGQMQATDHARGIPEPK